MPKLNDHQLTHLKIDKTREDVKRLHRLLQLLDVGENDLSAGVARALIDLLVGLDGQLNDQARIMQDLVNETTTLRDQVARLQSDMDFLLGKPSHEANG